MNRVSCGQFAALLLITDAFALFCLMGNVSIITACGFVTGVILQFLISIPTANFYKNGGTLKSSPKPFAWFYLIYIVLWGGLLFVMLWNASEEITIPAEKFSLIPEKFIITGLIAVTCLYASSPGEKALSRAALITAALGAVCIAVIVISAIPKSRVEYLADLSCSDGFFSELSRGFVLSGGLGSFIVLLGFTKGTPLKSAAGYFIGKAVLFAVVPATAAAAAGGIMEITDFPIITAAELSQPFSSQRIDSLFLIIFVILAVFAISVQTVTASYLLSTVIPSFKRFRSTAVLAAMTGSAFLMSGINQYSVIYSIAVVMAAAVVPLLMVLSKRAERRT
ncbi:MAG: hypothetical protein IJX77_08600 [Ruminococcus sp.]|nr:hypothetical protein [Ruminococcus sp.]